VAFDKNPLGRIKWVTGNICHLPEIKSGDFDAVISLSSLEHIPIENLELGIAEIRRVLKKDARWAVTTSGTEKLKTWFHEASKGLCFSIDDLKRYFKAESDGSTVPDEMLAKYKNNDYLKDNMSVFYKKSGDNGMPWGVWDPSYFPVGVCDSDV
jgi:ubiquinone/menaquinone biosynthesis C-methylase UbiE